ncbi:hypothetical protein ESCO_004831 [Escovopsis weberi]|uniref:Uncharacterized protein n=1 Tax=Escovopsis weberi TaxID=150374 RepID=A0A0M8MZZ1_ESCWE|nr:hypothetical protein ESCO_004831 [Escovopsis weberi]
MAVTHLLHGAIGLLMLTSLLELAFISATVSWLHRTAHGTLQIHTSPSSSSSFDLAWKPRTLMLDQGHTANGAAGTALILVGVGGIVVFWLRARPSALSSRLSAWVSPAWVALGAVSCLLTTAALAYVLAVTDAHAGQEIDLSVARALDASRAEKYPLFSWTPQGWFSAVLRLDVADAQVRSDIALHLAIIHGWECNLVVLFALHVVTTVLIVLDFLDWRRQRPKMTEYSNVMQKSSMATP